MITFFFLSIKEKQRIGVFFDPKHIRVILSYRNYSIIYLSMAKHQKSDISQSNMLGIYASLIASDSHVLTNCKTWISHLPLSKQSAPFHSDSWGPLPSHWTSGAALQMHVEVTLSNQSYTTCFPACSHISTVEIKSNIQSKRRFLSPFLSSTSITINLNHTIRIQSQTCHLFYYLFSFPPHSRWWKQKGEFRYLDWTLTPDTQHLGVSEQFVQLLFLHG